MEIKDIGIFAGGLLFGTAGVKLLSSKDAKKAYTHTSAAVLRAKECIMSTVTNVRENVDDIIAEAKDINEQRAEAAGEIIEEQEADVQDASEVEDEDVAAEQTEAVAE